MITLLSLMGLIIGLWVINVIFTPPYKEPKTIKIRPTLEDKDLKQWTELYQANCINYQRSIVSTRRLMDITWEQYAQLTGQEQWIEVPNPDYVKEEES